MWYTKIWESHSRVVNTLDLWSIYYSNIIGRYNDDRDSCGTARTGRLYTSSNDQVIDSNHPYYYPDINISLTLDVTTPGRSLLRFAQDAKKWHCYNACYIYRHNQLHLITIRNVERGQKLIIPKGTAHWQGQEDGLLFEHAYVAEYQGGGDRHEEPAAYLEASKFTHICSNGNLTLSKRGK